MSENMPYYDKVSPWSSHSLIAKQIHSLPSQSKILDVGAATGTLARMCQSRPLRLFGIEPNREWARIAAPLYEQLWVSSIIDMEDSMLAGYDAIVLGDILEHLSDPGFVLHKLVEVQSSGCLFLISVPNIVNLWIRLQMLLGHFDYTDRGILDRTHLRFFTRKTITGMVRKSGLKILWIRATPIPLELVSKHFTTPPGRWFHALLAAMTSVFPTLLGYQFIIGARKP